MVKFEDLKPGKIYKYKGSYNNEVWFMPKSVEKRMLFVLIQKHRDECWQEDILFIDFFNSKEIYEANEEEIKTVKEDLTVYIEDERHYLSKIEKLLNDIN